MQKSDSIGALAAALAQAQSKFPKIPKTKEVIVNSQKGSYTFKYAPLEDMIDILRPVLAEHGLGFTQGVDGETLVTMIFHSSGEWFAHSMPLPDAASAQMYGSQLTYRRRYSLKAALGVETDQDDADDQYRDDGKKKRATPNAGAFDHIPKERHEYVNRVASTIIDCFNAERPSEAYKAYVELSNEERLGAWTFLDSKQRRALKDMDAAKRQKESE